MTLLNKSDMPIVIGNDADHQENIRAGNSNPFLFDIRDHVNRLKVAKETRTEQQKAVNPVEFTPLKGMDAAIAFWKGIILPAYGEFDSERPKQAWLIGSDNDGIRNFYQIGIQDDPHGWLTKKKDDKKPESRVRVGNCLSLEEIINRCDGQQGLTYIPACPPNFPLDSRFNGSKIVWFECDVDSFEKQWENIQTLREYGLNPTAIVHSGGKSLHVYFLLDRSIDADQLRYLNSLFVKAFNGDKAVTRSTHQMRFVGVDRVKINDGVKTVNHQTLEYLNSDNVYTPFEFESKFEKLYKDLGISFESLEEAKARLQAEETKYEGIKFDPKDFEGDDIKSEINHLSKAYNDRVPNYSKGANTYGDRFPIANALGALGFSKDECLGLFPNVFRGLESNSMWKRLGEYYNKNPLFTIRKRLRILIGDNQVNFSDSFNEKYSHKWNQNPDDFDKDKWLAKVAEVQQKLTTLSHPPDILINQEYFPSLEALNQIKSIPNQGIVAFIGPRGAGKSTLIEQTKKHFKELGYNVISLTPTIALGRAQADNWQLTWMGELGADGVELNFLARNEKELGLCFNSLKRLIGRDYSEKHLIIIDECEQGLSVPVTSTLLKDSRPITLKSFKTLIKESFDNGGAILLSDADLNNPSIDYISSLASEKPPVFIIKNEVKPKQWDVTLYSGGLTDHDAVNELFYDLELGFNCILATDSKNRAQALEKEFFKRFPSEICININGDSTQESETQEIVKDINKAILKYKPRLLIYTQSMGSGVSIDGTIKDDNGKKGFNSEVYAHFSKVYGSFCNEDPDQILQLLARYRKPVPRVIWCKDSGFSDDSQKSYIPEVIKKNILKDRQQTSDIIELGKSEVLYNEEDEITPQALVDALQSMINPETKQWDNPHIDHYCRCKAKRNYAISQMGILLREKLIEEGHNLKEYANGQANTVSDAISENLTEIKWDEATAIANAEDIPIDLAKALNKKQSHSKNERDKIKKAFLKLELPELELTPEFIFEWILKDKRKTLDAIKLFFFIQNPEIAKELDRREFKHHLKGFVEHGIIHAPDIKTYSTRVKLVKDLRLFELINLTDFTREYRATDKDVQDFMKRAYLMRYRLKSAFGLNVTKQTDPMRFIFDWLGKKLGLGSFSYQYREREKRVRVYRLDGQVMENPQRLEILKIWGQKYAEIHIEQAFSVSQHSGDYIKYKNGNAVTDNHPKDPQDEHSTSPDKDCHQRSQRDPIYRVGDVIKDSISGRLFTVTQVKGDRYECSNDDGEWATIPFTDALSPESMAA
jgi:hypothetical protein